MFEILPQLLVNSLITGSVYALVTAGLSITYGILGILNFAHGHLLMLGAYLFYFFFKDLSWPLAPALLGTMGIMAVLSKFILRFFVSPFQKFNPLLCLVTTMALGVMLESIVSMWFGVNVKSLYSESASTVYQFGSVYITRVQIIIILSGFLGMSLMAFLIHLTPLGRSLRAMPKHIWAFESLGRSSNFYTSIFFALSLMLASLSGILVGFDTSLQPTMGAGCLIKSFAAMVLGGLGNFWGSVAASYVLGFVENLSIGMDFGGYSLPAGYKDAFAFLIILLVLLLRPAGLFGFNTRKA